MAAKNKPYEQFGPFVLFKKLESDALGDLWRAARIDGSSLGPLVALRRLTGGSRESLASSAHAARHVAASLSGPSFVRDQVIDTIDGVPYIAYDYAGGRSLRHVVDRARGGTGNTPNPIPLDQAIAIAEKVALSLATTGELRAGGERLLHGGLIPQFVWISDDGEIRVAGQQLGAGLIASLRNGAVAADIGRYFAPEYQALGVASKSTEVFSLGAMLYLLVTGAEPPDAANSSAFALAVRAGKTPGGAAVPEDIRAVLEKSLTLDPAARYASVGDMKAALSALANSGRYSATTFNLAFYLSNLLKKEFESEALERERESKVNVLPYVEALQAPKEVPVAAAPVPVAVHAEVAAAPVARRKSKVPVAVAAAGALIAIAGGAWVTLGSRKPAPQPAKVQLASAVAPVVPAPAPIAVPEPIVASATPEVTTTVPETATSAEVDEAARKKAFEDAVKKKLQEELLKLQAEYTRQLQQQQSRNAPVLGVSNPQPAPVRQENVEERTVSAAELDQQRRETTSRADAAPAVVPQQVVQTQTQPPTQTVAPAVSTQAPSPAPAVVQAVAVREGDVVDLSAVDTQPRMTREPRPVYPAIAARQRIVATILTSILVSETGEVIDVKVLRGEPRFGFNEAAVRALRGARYSPAVKDGKRVKTWVPQIIQFKP